MADIMSYIRNRDALETDPGGFMLDLDEWSEALALERANAEGIRMTDDHWGVVRFLRERYRHAGPSGHAREISQAMEEAFHAQGGSRWLYRLFPGGPVRQACFLAGLPVPGDSSNASFGNVF